MDAGRAHGSPPGRTVVRFMVVSFTVRTRGRRGEVTSWRLARRTSTTGEGDIRRVVLVSGYVVRSVDAGRLVDAFAPRGDRRRIGPQRTRRRDRACPRRVGCHRARSGLGPRRWDADRTAHAAGGAARRLLGDPSARGRLSRV